LPAAAFLPAAFLIYHYNQANVGLK